VTCPYHQLDEGSLSQSHCNVSPSTFSRRIRSGFTLWRVPVISYPKDQDRSQTVTCPYHQLHERSVRQSHFDVSLTSGTGRILTEVTLWRVPIISYPKNNYLSHIVISSYHQLPEVSGEQSHCDVSLSTISRRICTAVTLWHVPVVSYPKEQYRFHTVTCPYHHLRIGFRNALTLRSVPLISYPKNQYSSHTMTCPYNQLPEASVPQLHCHEH
jgi:proteasome lid subunit RPN8/RPN11